MRQVAVFSGSFNPIHNAHITLAEYIAHTLSLDAVHMMLSPLNPLKSSATLLPDAYRMTMLRLALHAHPTLVADDTELSLPLPSYTIRTLDYLSARHPDTRFHLVIGQDNLEIFEHWHEWQSLAARYPLIVYPRPGCTRTTLPQAHSLHFLHDAPTSPISSSLIRNRLHKGLSVKPFVPTDVDVYLRRLALYAD